MSEVVHLDGIQMMVLIMASIYVPMSLALWIIFSGKGLKMALLVCIPIQAAIMLTPYFIGYR